MMNFAPKATEQYHSQAQRIGVSRGTDFDVSSFSDVHVAVRDMMISEGLSTSEGRIMSPKLDEQLNLINDLTGSFPGGVIQGKEFLHGFSQDYKERMLDENKDLIRKLGKENPEAGFRTLDDILLQTKAETRVTRERAIRAMLQAEGLSGAGMITGTMRAIVEDPLIVGSMVASAVFTKGVGGSALSRAIGVAKTEAIIGSVSEAMIQPSVFAWKKRIDSPYSIQEAAFNIMLAGGLGAILGGGGSLIYDAATFRKAARLKTDAFKEGDTGAKYEAEILNRYADELDAKPKDVELKEHFDAIDKATLDIEEGVKPDIDQVVREIPHADADTVKLDGVSTRAMADLAYQMDLLDEASELVKEVPESLKKQSMAPEDNLKAEAKLINDQIEELRKTDFDVPVEQVLDAEGEIKITTRKASELFDEIEADEKSINDLITCYGGV